MGKKRTIAVLTGTRAEYGLLFYLLKEIQNDSSLKLKLLVTGTHLDPAYGNTFHLIKKDGFKNTTKIPIPLKEDSALGMLKSLSVAVMSIGKKLEKIKPDILVLLGDRYETFAAAQAAMILSIPVAHIHGGELTEGAMDESMRHAITKLSHIHFTSSIISRLRVIQLGENPKRVFYVGAPGLDQIKNLKLLNKKQLETQLGIQLRNKNILFTYHPETLRPQLQKQNIHNILRVLEDALSTDSELSVVATLPNADPQGRMLAKELKTFSRKYPHQFFLFANLGQLRYLSMLKISQLVMGNSSSGILEAPSMGIPTLNIGSRQKGRERALSIVDVEADKKIIKQAMIKCLKNKNKIPWSRIKSPYGKFGASKKIKHILKNISLEKILIKSFYDINFK